MHDEHDHATIAQPIEAMPAAPEADQGTRDADAPTWSAPTEGHPDLPLTPRAALASDTAAAPSDTTPAKEPVLVTGPVPATSITADHVDVHQGGAQRIQGRQVTITQGGAMVIRGQQIRVEQGGALAIVGDRVEMREGGAFLVLARRVSGQVNVALDWRGLAVLLAGLLAFMVVRGRR